MKMSERSSSELHRCIKEDRWVNAVFAEIAGKAKQRIKAAQAILMKRGHEVRGVDIKSIRDIGNLKHPSTENLKHPRAMVGGVTDHAIVRFLERVKGVDLAAVEREMQERIAGAESYFGGAVKVDSENISYILREDGMVVSVMPHEWLSEADGVAAEYAIKRNLKDRKDAKFRAMAAAGIDTSPEALAKNKSSSG